MASKTGMKKILGVLTIIALWFSLTGMMSTTNTKNTFSGNGVTRDWTYSFQILSTDGSDIQIWLTSPTGVVSQVTASYSINVVTSTVTYPTIASLMAPLPLNWTLELRRVLPLTQSIDLVNQGAFDANTLEGALDKAIALCQQIKAEVNTGVPGPTGATGSGLSDGGLTSLPEKTSMADNDLILLEDSADSLKMKKVKRTNIDAGKLNGEIVGTAANNILALDGSAKIPAVDGTQILGLPKPSVFSTFGGDGSQGAHIVDTAHNFSDINDSNRPGIAQFTNLTIDTGQILTIDTGFAYIGISGTLTLNGIINADAQGAQGGDRNQQPADTAVAHHGKLGLNSAGEGNSATATVNGGVVYSGEVVMTAVENYYQKPVDLSLAGAGGAGGSYYDGALPSTYGGVGGGAGGGGGKSYNNGTASTVGQATPTTKKLALTRGLGDNSTEGIYSDFSFLRFYGAGGGSGGTQGYGGSWDVSSYGGAGGRGGGEIYIECNTLVTGANGVLTADGGNGENGVNIGFTLAEGGGGGGGGVIIVRAKTITSEPSGGNITVTGGAGGTSTDAGARPGSAGAAGFKDIVGISA